MKFVERLKAKQPLVARSFSYALESDRLSHAYILIGEPGTPIKETALFLAKSLLCDNPTPFADEECVTCQRIDRGEYPDFIFLNGEEESIKKDDVKETMNLFQLTPLERKGKMVYVIHLVENMVPEAENAILKFLEEPNPNTFAFLTTQNEEKVLPTIISRCEKLRLLLTPREEVRKEAVSIGVDETDAEILSHFYNDPNTILSKSADGEYVAIRDLCLSFLDAAVTSPHLTRFIAEKDIAPLLSTKPKSRLFFDILAIYLQEIINIKNGRTPSLPAYAKILAEVASKLPHVENSLLSALTLRGEIELNIKIGLLLNHLAGVIAVE